MIKFLLIALALILSVNSFASTSNILNVGNAGINGTDWAQYTPTFQGFGTATNIQALYRRVGDSVELNIRFTGGTATSVECRIGLPSGLTSANSAKIPGQQLVGWGTTNSAGTSQPAPYITSGVTYLTLARTDSTTNPTTIASDCLSVFGSNREMFIFAKVPISGWTSGSNASAKNQFVSFGGSSEISNCTSSPCTIYRQSGGASSVTRVGTGQYRINWPASIWSARPACTISPVGVSRACRVETTSTATQTDILCDISAGAADLAIDATCMGL